MVNRIVASVTFELKYIPADWHKDVLDNAPGRPIIMILTDSAFSEPQFGRDDEERNLSYQEQLSDSERVS